MKIYPSKLSPPKHVSVPDTFVGDSRQNLAVLHPISLNGCGWTRRVAAFPSATTPSNMSVHRWDSKAPMPFDVPLSAGWGLIRAITANVSPRVQTCHRCHADDEGRTDSPKLPE